MDEDFSGVAVFGGIIVAVVVLLWYAIAQDIDAKEDFMQACLKDHKQYECTAMWRAGQQNYVPIVIPMVIR